MDIFDDRKLLDYETYEDYLDSLLQTDDLFYLRNRDFARINAALGYRLVYGYLLDKIHCNGNAFAQCANTLHCSFL